VAVALANLLDAAANETPDIGWHTMKIAAFGVYTAVLACVAATALQ